MIDLHPLIACCSQVGKIYAVYAVLELLNAVVQLLVLQPVYYFTVVWHKPFIWYLLCAINVAAVVMMLWVCVEDRRNERREARAASKASTNLSMAPVNSEQ